MPGLGAVRIQDKVSIILCKLPRIALLKNTKVSVLILLIPTESAYSVF